MHYRLKYKLFFTALFILLSSTLPLLAQTFTVKGLITDASTNDPLIGVTLFVKKTPDRGVLTNEDGTYEIRLPKGNYTLVVGYMGYENKEFKVSLDKNVVKNIEMESSSYNLNEVVVSTSRNDANVAAPQSGMQKMTMQEISLLPVLFGERDVLKTIQLMPGVKPANEGSTGFFVRGGTADQNMILLDDVSVYNASHLMGFFSTFNPDAVSDVTLYKGAMPAQYGERLSSILDVQMRNGNNKEYHVDGGIGLISSKLALEGPIQKGKSSFIVAGRRTYADVIAKSTGMEEMQGKSLYFYDLNLKLNFVLSDKDRLSFSGYWGKDKLGIDKVVQTDWGNLLGTLKWNRTMNSKWLSSTSLIFNKYSYHVDLSMNLDLNISSVIEDYAIKQEFLFSPNARNIWKFGFQSTHHDLAPGKYKYEESKGETMNMKHRYSWENAVYASNTLAVSDKLEVIYGLRLSTFSALGNGDYYTLDAHHNVIDTISYKAGKFVKSYINLEPRISFAYRFNKESSVKAAYARTTQNLHLLSLVTFSSPYDRWISSSNNVKPQIGDQYTLGYFKNFANNAYEFSAEVYYKDLKNQLDLKDNAIFDHNEDVESELLSGKGRAYGIEFLLKKTTGRLTGWIGYTLSKSEKRIDGINNDKWYSAVQDRTHDISIVGVYKLNRKWSLSAAWVYYTGNAVTYPSGKYVVDGELVPYYSERNGYRAPAYHRLDLGATCTLKKTKKYSSELAFSLYNAYGRENAYLIDFRGNDDDPTQSTVYQYSLFRFVPSISWNFKF